MKKIIKLSEKDYFEKLENNNLIYSENIIYKDSAGNKLDSNQINFDDYIGDFYIDEDGKIIEIILFKDKIKAKEFQKKFSETLEKRNNFELLKFENKDIHEILKKSFELDQFMRKKGEEIDSKKDYENLKIAVSILENNMEYLLKKGKNEDFLAIFHIIQHGPLKFQKKYIDFFIEISKKGKINKSELPKMIDRILLNEGKSQIYGTQYIRNMSTGKLELYKIENLDKLEEKRKSMNLGTIEEQNKLINK